MIINRKDFCFNGIRWVLLARDDRSTNETHKRLYSSGTHVTATDGYRLHRYKTDVLPEGTYRVITATKNLIVVELNDIPNMSEFLNNTLSEDGGKEICEGGKLPFVLAKIIRALPEDRSINPDYLKDALSVTTDFKVIYTPRGLIKFTNCDYGAMIAPCGI